MIPVIKIRRNIDCWGAERFPVERKENGQGEQLQTIYPHLLIWEAKHMIFQNADRVVYFGNQ